MNGVRESSSIRAAVSWYQCCVVYAPQCGHSKAVSDTDGGFDLLFTSRRLLCDAEDRMMTPDELRDSCGTPWVTLPSRHIADDGTR